MNAPVLIVCRLKHLAVIYPPRPDEEVVPCQRCGKDLLLSPKGKEQMKKHPDLTFLTLCVDCGREAALILQEAGKGIDAELTPAAEERLRERGVTLEEALGLRPGSLRTNGQNDKN